MNFTRESLMIDAAAETGRIVNALRKTVGQSLRRFGGVVGISGGVDSAVVLALAVRAFGPEKVIAVMMPERDSDPLSETLARALAARFGVTPVLEDITLALEGFRCYLRRDEAIRHVVPEYDAAAGWKAKIVLPQNLLDGGSLNVFSVTVVSPDGRVQNRPLPPAAFLQIVAASNFKQRTRMAMLYYHAEARNYAVLGTANRNEHAQGFFVKYGDGGVDVQTIAHLFKTQIYQLAAYLDVPPAIRERTPTTDTYSAPCTQQEFFFRLPFEIMDLLWSAMENGVSPEETGQVMGLTPDQVRRVFDDLIRKERGTAYLRMSPIPI
jgi:NAD+ synthase